jgi:pantothenate synthetase
MYGSKEALAEFVVKQAAQPFELPVIVAQAIAMRKVKGLTIEFRNYALAMQNNATLLFQVITHPQVVITNEEMHFYAHVGEFRNLP